MRSDCRLASGVANRPGGVAFGWIVGRHDSFAAVERSTALNFWNRDFFDAIERKDAAELWKQAMSRPSSGRLTKCMERALDHSCVQRVLCDV